MLTKLGDNPFKVYTTTLYTTETLYFMWTNGNAPVLQIHTVNDSYFTFTSYDSNYLNVIGNYGNIVEQVEPYAQMFLEFKERTLLFEVLPVFGAHDKQIALRFWKRGDNKRPNLMATIKADFAWLDFECKMSIAVPYIGKPFHYELNSLTPILYRMYAERE